MAQIAFRRPPELLAKLSQIFHRNSEHCRLYQGRNPVRQNPQQILVFFKPEGRPLFTNGTLAPKILRAANLRQPVLCGPIVVLCAILRIDRD